MTFTRSLCAVLAVAALTNVAWSQDAGGAATPAQVERVRTGGMMGTDYRITAIGPDAAVLDAAITAALAELQRVEDLMTDWRASPLTTLNEAAGAGATEVPRELAAIIARGLLLGELSGGAFDITFAGAGKLWDFKARPPLVPTDAAIAAALQHVDYRRVVVDEKANSVTLPKGFRLGLGGIAKGYGIDRAMTVLRQNGVEHGIVSVGGDMKVLGKKNGKSWEIGIAHPRDRERALAALHVSNTCVVTSGDYERFFEYEGKRFHHILDPRTGRPSTGCMSATVVAQNAEYADALATALCVLGPKPGLELVARLPRVEAIVVGMDGSVQASAGLRDSLVGVAAADTGR